MNTATRFLDGLLHGQRRTLLLLAFLGAGLGVFQWFTMARQEDPRIPDRYGLMVIPFPGADAETLERLVVEPLEEKLAEVDAIHFVQATARAGAAIVRIELLDEIYDTDRGWDEVEDAIAEARAEWPEGVLEPRTDWKLMDVEGVVLGVTGTDDPIALLRAAETVREDLLDLKQVSRVLLLADPGEQITVALDDAAARRLALTPAALARQIKGRSQTIPGGSLEVGERVITVDPASDLDEVAHLRRLPVALPTGQTVPLDRIARVGLEAEAPATELMRLDGRVAVGLGVIPRQRIDTVAFGQQLSDRLDALERRIAPLSITRVAYQPTRVESRLNGLALSLSQGVGIVALVLVLFMGLRVGLVVASVVPLVALSSLTLYAMNGGMLQQISVAGLVISLGLLVDNAVVVAERVQWLVDRGMPTRSAAVEAIRELFIPLLASTGTTLAAFMPLLFSTGGPGDFTRAIPVLVMLTLAVSFIFAVTVTPTLAALTFKPRKAISEEGSAPVRWLARLPARRPVLVVIGVLMVLGAAVSLAPQVKQQFFPSADRNQVVLALELPEGARLSATDAAARTLERALLSWPEVKQVATFVGRSTPQFYYNLNRKPSAPQVAQILVTTGTTDDVPGLIERSRAVAHADLPGVIFTASTLEQGPPTAAPVEIRIFTEDVEQVLTLANEVHALLASTPGAIDVRHEAGLGAPALTLGIDDDAAARRGLGRADLAMALMGRTRGLPAGAYRGGDDPVPIVVRAPEGVHLPPARLTALEVGSASGMAPGLVPLAAVATPRIEMKPSVIHRRDRQRMVRVLAQLAPGASWNQVLRSVSPKIDALFADHPEARWVVGGDAEASMNANLSIARAAPFGTLTLILVLLIQFRSFRRLGLIMLTIPLSGAGVIPGLVLADQPFGFTSLLGVIALAGIVVNNAIILLDVVDAARAGGATVAEALQEGIRVRLRPILLTTITTIVGLIPLLYSPATLWPPLASAMISGLAASTLLTLLVVPAIYRLLFRDPPTRDDTAPAEGGSPEEAPIGGPAPALANLALMASVVALGSALWPQASEARGSQPDTPAEVPRAPEVKPALQLYATPDSVGDRAVTLAEAIAEAGAESAEVEAALARQQAADAQVDQADRQAFLPTVTAQVELIARSSDLGVTTPLGRITQTPDRNGQAAVILSQPLLDLARQLHRRATADQTAEAARRAVEVRRQTSRLAAADAWLNVQVVDASARATDAFIESLTAQEARLAGLVADGRALEVDRLRISVALADAQQGRHRLDAQRAVALSALRRALDTEERVEPVPLDQNPSGLAQALEPAQPAVRPELQAIDAQIAALEAQRAELTAGYLPTLSADGRYIYSTQDNLDPQDWFQGSLVLTWTPFAADARRTGAQAIDAQIAALSADRRALERAFSVAESQARAALRTALNDDLVAQRSVSQAARAVEILKARYAEGRSTVTDLLEVEATLRREQTRQSVARAEAVRAWLRLNFARGVRVQPPESI